VRPDGLIWLAIPLIGVGLWLLHDSLQGHAPRPPRPRLPLLLRVQDYLMQADLARWTPARLALVCAISAAWLGAAVQLSVGWPLATVLAVLLGVLVPVLWVRARHGRIHAETRQGLARALAQLEGSLAIGQTIERGAQTLARDGPPRLRLVFAQFCRDADELDLGRAALRLRDRLADPVADLFVAGLLVHVELGGDDFRPMLAQLEQMVRGQQSIRDQIAVARVRLRYSSYVLLAAPVVVLLVLRSWSPVVSAYFDSPQGMVTLFVCAVVMLAGYLAMLYLGRLPGEERVLIR
jgi:tight adherence protein B